MANSDFIDIELSEAGLALVGADGAVRVTALNFSYQLRPGEKARVLTSEWSRALSLETHQGRAIFQQAAEAE